MITVGWSRFSSIPFRVGFSLRDSPQFRWQFSRQTMGSWCRNDRQFQETLLGGFVEDALRRLHIIKRLCPEDV